MFWLCLLRFNFIDINENILAYSVKCALFVFEITLSDLQFSHVDSSYDKSHCSAI